VFELSQHDEQFDWPMCVHVCAGKELIAIVSPLEDFEDACEALKRVRRDKFTVEDAEN
jgi:hypothetical protein